MTLIYPTSPSGNDDFAENSVISSREVDGNFAAIADYLDTAFVTSLNIAPGSIDDVSISDADPLGVDLTIGISNAKLQNDAVDSRVLADDAVTTGKILDGTIEDADVSDPATNPGVTGISGTKIQDASIPSSALGPDILFPIVVTNEVVNFPIAGATVQLNASVLEPAVPLTLTGVGGAPAFVEGVDFSVNYSTGQVTDLVAGLTPLTNYEVDYTAAASGPPPNSVGSPQIVDGSILDIDINAAAGIQLSKLATDPLDRANHTGTQLASTISNFTAAVQATAVGGDLTGTVASMQIAPDSVGATEIASGSVGTSEIGTLPFGRILRTGTGTALAVGGTFQEVRYPTTDNLQGGMTTYNPGTGVEGFTVPITGVYNINASVDIDNADPGSSAALATTTAIGIRIRNVTTGEVLSKNTVGWNGSSLQPSVECNSNVKLTAGDDITAEFVGNVAGILPDGNSGPTTTGSQMSIVWVSD